MNLRDIGGMFSVLGLTMVGLVIGNGCQPPPQEVPPTPASSTPDGMENPSNEIDLDPDMDPRNTQGS